MSTQFSETIVCEQATGCAGAGDFRRWAESQGYSHCEVFDWTSTAGDWTFLVSRDGIEWRFMFQRNNYPRAGFARTIEDSPVFYGSPQEALADAWEYCCNQ